MPRIVPAVSIILGFLSAALAEDPAERAYHMLALPPKHADKPRVNGWAERRVDEKVDRGMVALPDGAGKVYLGWRLLRTDPQGTAFDIYRSLDGGAPVKLNTEPLSATTDFIDREPSPGRESVYWVQPILSGRGLEPSEKAVVKVGARATPHHGSIKLQGTYSTQKIAVGDLDGMVADIDPSIPGLECFATEDPKGGSSARYLFSAGGKLLATGEDVPGCRNWIFWDGDLLRETFGRAMGRGPSGRGGISIAKHKGPILAGGIDGSIAMVADLIGAWRTLAFHGAGLRSSSDVRGRKKRSIMSAMALSLVFGFYSGMTEATPLAKEIGSRPSWTVFVPVGDGLPRGPELLVNPGFDDGAPGTAASWRPYGSGYEIDETGGRNGGRALKLVNPIETGVHGAYQVIALDQPARKSLYFSAWSKAEGVTGKSDLHYSLYLDIYYTDGTPLYGQTLRFGTGTQDWEFLQGFIVTEKPIRQISAYCLLRNAHAGSAWFDDLSIQEVDAEVLDFDRAQVAAQPLAEPPPYGGETLKVVSGDGLSLGLSEEGGAVTEVAIHGAPVSDPLKAFSGGFIARDVARRSAFLHVGGALSLSGGRIQHASAIQDLGLDFSATYEASADSIAIRAELRDTTGGDRAISLYFALPLAAEGWTWGDDIRRSRPVAGVRELENTIRSWYGEIGANGFFSCYPWACLWGSTDGIALANPLSRPRILRLAHHPASSQLYAAFDLGLSPLTSRFPGSASVEFILYRFNSRGGFRAAAKGYYDRFPEAFARRVPPEEEGIWIAFTDLSPIPDISDFGIAFHELGGEYQISGDDAAGIRSFRYIAEPWSHWLPIDEPSVDPANHDQVVAHLADLAGEGNARAEATLSSGFFGEDGRYVFESTIAPWCEGQVGCAVFTVNPDPDIADPLHPQNKGTLEWNPWARGLYLRNPGLDGEYVDSFLGKAMVLDFRASHFAATDTPLSFRPSDARLGIPMVFAVTEYSRWLAEDVHEVLGKWTMANAILWWIPWGADLFDCMGTETDWLGTGSFEPLDDRILSYFRTLSCQRPYCFLMNTDFARLTTDLVERYFQVCLFYGIYPSMFSHNAADDQYWDDPALYERDRPLFVRYIPLIRELNRGGWQPMTGASTSDPNVYIERFGSWPDLRFTLRNVTEAPVPVEVIIEAEELGIPPLPGVASRFLSGGALSLSGPAPVRTVSLILEPLSSEVLAFLLDSDGWQIPGDANQDLAVDLSDAIRVLFHLFTGEVPALPCEGRTAASPGQGELSLLDWGDDGAIDVSDIVGTLGWLFLGQPAHALGAKCRRIAGCSQRCSPE